MKRKVFCLLMVLAICAVPAAAKEDYIKWVEFDVSAAAMDRALALQEQYREQERTVNWIDILALAAVRHGSGNFPVGLADKAAAELASDRSPKEILGKQYRYYQYYQEAYGAVLRGVAGSYAIQKQDGTWQSHYGVKAFSPIAEGYWYTHYDDFGAGRSYGFRRRHLGNDLMGSLGTPIVAVEGGTVEAMGWNKYGGWRIGIRSHDCQRYYYYAHLRKDTPFAAGLEVGDTVQAGEVIGFMGRTGYSDRENVNNIEVVHLHFGLQLIFDESQKECNNEIWVDVYELVKFLSRHQSSVVYNREKNVWERVYPYRDLDISQAHGIGTMAENKQKGVRI